MEAFVYDRSRRCSRRRGRTCWRENRGHPFKLSINPPLQWVSMISTNTLRPPARPLAIPAQCIDPPAHDEKPADQHHNSRSLAERAHHQTTLIRTTNRRIMSKGRLRWFPLRLAEKNANILGHAYDHPATSHILLFGRR